MDKINIENMEIEMAYSIINMKLRDFYSSLEEYCENENQNLKKLIEYFENKGYYYDEVNNMLKRT